MAETVTVNPATGETLASYPETTPAEVEAALDRSARAFADWRKRSHEERGAVLQALAAELRRSRDEAAAVITAEMGKTLGEARAEVEKSAWVCEYYAETAAEHLRP